MSLRQINKRLRFVCLLVCLGICAIAPRLTHASEYHGRVTFGGLPVPGATIKATRDNQTLIAVSDLQGA